MLILLLALLQPPPPPHSYLTVIGGTGSGAYGCFQKVPIEAPRRITVTQTEDGKKTTHLETFSEWIIPWDGDTTVEPLHRNRATVIMPCGKNTEVKAHYHPDPPKRKS